MSHFLSVHVHYGGVGWGVWVWTNYPELVSHPGVFPTSLQIRRPPDQDKEHNQ